MTGDRLQTVHLVGFPLKIWARTREHHDELMREFTLISLSENDEQHRSVPKRLLELVDKLTNEFRGFSDASDARRDEAAESGLDSIDLSYHVPTSAAEASKALGAMLDEADEYCRSGQALLTLESPPEVKSFRRWYLDQFIGQLSGAAPTPWPEYAAAESRR